MEDDTDYVKGLRTALQLVQEQRRDWEVLTVERGSTLASRREGALSTCRSLEAFLGRAIDTAGVSDGRE